MIDKDFILLLFFLFISFFCSCSETSLFSLSVYKIEEIKIKHPRRGKIISNLLSKPQHLLVTILICNTFANIFATLTGIRIFEKYFKHNSKILDVIVMTFLILVFGEVTPKSIAIKAGPLISIMVSPIFYFLRKVLYPFIFVFRQIAGFLVWINSILFYRNVKESTDFKQDEVIDVIKESQKSGILNEEEGNILGNVIEFVNKNIWEIMRPRNEIFSLCVDNIIKDVIELIKEKKYSRIPIWKDNEENIIGILHIKKLLNITDYNKSFNDYIDLLEKPYFIPESIKAEQLLKNFQQTNNHLAIVIDEYGGIAGLITLEDVIESIIGEVVDKEDIIPLYHKYNSSMIEIFARMEIEEFNKVFKCSIKSKEAKTVGGYLLEKIKRIPKVGENFFFDGLQFRITMSQQNKIDKILITKMKKRGKVKE